MQDYRLSPENTISYECRSGAAGSSYKDSGIDAGIANISYRHFAGPASNMCQCIPGSLVKEEPVSLPR